MPIAQSQEMQTGLSAKLVHATKQNSFDEPIQLAFSVTDDQGNEQIVTAEIPYGNELYEVCQQNNWLQRGSRSTVRSFQGRRRAA